MIDVTLLACGMCCPTSGHQGFGNPHDQLLHSSIITLLIRLIIWAEVLGDIEIFFPLPASHARWGDVCGETSPLSICALRISMVTD